MTATVPPAVDAARRRVGRGRDEVVDAGELAAATPVRRTDCVGSTPEAATASRRLARSMISAGVR